MRHRRKRRKGRYRATPETPVWARAWAGGESASVPLTVAQLQEETRNWLVSTVLHLCETDESFQRFIEDPDAHGGGWCDYAIDDSPEGVNDE
jgi:hypothetical protein